LADVIGDLYSSEISIRAISPRLATVPQDYIHIGDAHVSAASYR
jgi:hypothetical protein